MAKHRHTLHIGHRNVDSLLWWYIRQRSSSGNVRKITAIFFRLYLRTSTYCLLSFRSIDIVFRTCGRFVLDEKYIWLFIETKHVIRFGIFQYLNRLERQRCSLLSIILITIIRDNIMKLELLSNELLYYTSSTNGITNFVATNRSYNHPVWLIRYARSNWIVGLTICVMESIVNSTTWHCPRLKARVIYTD